MESQYKIGISDIHDYALVKGQKNYDFGVKYVGLYMHLNVSLDQLKFRRRNFVNPSYLCITKTLQYAMPLCNQ